MARGRGVGALPRGARMAACPAGLKGEIPGAARQAEALRECGAAVRFGVHGSGSIMGPRGVKVGTAAIKREFGLDVEVFFRIVGYNKSAAVVRQLPPLPPPRRVRAPPLLPAMSAMSSGCVPSPAPSRMSRGG